MQFELPGELESAIDDGVEVVLCSLDKKIQNGDIITIQQFTEEVLSFSGLVDFYSKQLRINIFELIQLVERRENVDPCGESVELFNIINNLRTRGIDILCQLTKSHIIESFAGLEDFMARNGVTFAHLQEPPTENSAVQRQEVIIFENPTEYNLHFLR